MHIIVKTNFCKFENGFRSHILFKDDIAQETIEVKNAAEVEAAMDAAFKRTAAEFPGRSFMVCQFRHPRCKGRAFAGYKNLPYVRDYKANEPVKA